MTGPRVYGEVSTPIPTVNDKEEAFEAVALDINNILRVASVATFPAVSFTPISVHRTC